MIGQDFKSVEELNQPKPFKHKTTGEKLHLLIEIILAVVTITVSIWTGLIFRDKMREESERNPNSEKRDEDDQEETTELLST